MMLGDLYLRVVDEQGEDVSVSIQTDYMVLYTTLRVTRAHNEAGKFKPDAGTLTIVVADPKEQDPLGIFFPGDHPRNNKT